MGKTWSRGTNSRLPFGVIGILISLIIIGIPEKFTRKRSMLTLKYSSNNAKWLNFYGQKVESTEEMANFGNYLRDFIL